MKFMQWAKDGGPSSPVDGFFLLEIKQLFSVALLRFSEGRREAFHSHAFNAFTWFLSGDMEEEDIDGTLLPYKRRIIPKFTPKEKLHRVKARETSWCLTIRGPWSNYWQEYEEDTDTSTLFTWGRKVIETVKGKANAKKED